MNKEVEGLLMGLGGIVSPELIRQRESKLRENWKRWECSPWRLTWWNGDLLNRDIVQKQDTDYLKLEDGALEIFKRAAKIFGCLFDDRDNWVSLFSGPILVAETSPSVYLRTPKGTETKKLINGISDVHIEFRWDAKTFRHFEKNNLGLLLDLELRSPTKEAPFGVGDYSEGRQILCSIARDKNGQMTGFRLNNHFKEETVPLDNTALAKKLSELIETAPKVRLSYMKL